MKQEWQPIESAPKTSKTILVYCNERKNTYAVTWWNERWEYTGTSCELNQNPTHWMPLPEPPAP